MVFTRNQRDIASLVSSELDWRTQKNNKKSCNAILKPTGRGKKCYREKMQAQLKNRPEHFPS